MGKKKLYRSIIFTAIAIAASITCCAAGALKGILPGNGLRYKGSFLTDAEAATSADYYSAHNASYSAAIEIPYEEYRNVTVKSAEATVSLDQAAAGRHLGESIVSPAATCSYSSDSLDVSGDVSGLPDDEDYTVNVSAQVKYEALEIVIINHVIYKMWVWHDETLTATATGHTSGDPTVSSGWELKEKTELKDYSELTGSDGSTARVNDTVGTIQISRTVTYKNLNVSYLLSGNKPLFYNKGDLTITGGEYADQNAEGSFAEGIFAVNEKSVTINSGSITAPSVGILNKSGSVIFTGEGDTVLRTRVGGAKDAVDPRPAADMQGVYADQGCGVVNYGSVNITSMKRHTVTIAGRANGILTYKDGSIDITGMQTGTQQIPSAFDGQMETVPQYSVRLYSWIGDAVDVRCASASFSGAEFNGVIGIDGGRDGYIYGGTFALKNGNLDWMHRTMAEGGPDIRAYDCLIIGDCEGYHGDLTSSNPSAGAATRYIMGVADFGSFSAVSNVKIFAYGGSNKTAGIYCAGRCDVTGSTDITSSDTGIVIGGKGSLKSVWADRSGFKSDDTDDEQFSDLDDRIKSITGQDEAEDMLDMGKMSTVSMNDGSIKGRLYGVYNRGTFNLSGGTISGSEKAGVYQNGTFLMKEDAAVDYSNVIFLTKNHYIDEYSALTQKECGRIDLGEDDRKLGRTLIRNVDKNNNEIKDNTDTFIDLADKFKPAFDEVLNHPSAVRIGLGRYKREAGIAGSYSGRLSKNDFLDRYYPKEDARQNGDKGRYVLSALFSAEYHADFADMIPDLRIQVPEDTSYYWMEAQRFTVGALKYDKSRAVPYYKNNDISEGLVNTGWDTLENDDTYYVGDDAWSLEDKSSHTVATPGGIIVLGDTENTPEYDEEDLTAIYGYDHDFYAAWDTGYSFFCHGNHDTDDYGNDMNGSKDFMTEKVTMESRIPSNTKDSKDIFIRQELDKSHYDTMTGKNIPYTRQFSFQAWSLDEDAVYTDKNLIPENAPAADLEFYKDYETDIGMEDSDDDPYYMKGNIKLYLLALMKDRVSGDKGNVVDIYAVWDEFPEIQAHEVWFYDRQLSDEQAVRDKLLSTDTVSAYDHEDGSIAQDRIELVLDMDSIRNLGNTGSAQAYYLVTDKYGFEDVRDIPEEDRFADGKVIFYPKKNTTRYAVTVNVITDDSSDSKETVSDGTSADKNSGTTSDTMADEPLYVRFIDSTSIDTLARESVWRSDKYSVILKKALTLLDSISSTEECPAYQTIYGSAAKAVSPAENQNSTENTFDKWISAEISEDEVSVRFHVKKDIRSYELQRKNDTDGSGWAAIKVIAPLSQYPDSTYYLDNNEAVYTDILPAEGAYSYRIVTSSGSSDTASVSYIKPISVELSDFSDPELSDMKGTQMSWDPSSAAASYLITIRSAGMPAMTLTVTADEAAECGYALDLGEILSAELVNDFEWDVSVLGKM